MQNPFTDLLSFSATHPHWLWLLPVAVGWIVWLSRTSYVQLSPWRRLLATGLRLVVATGIILALAGFQWRKPIDALNVFFVLDQSQSLPPVQQENALQWANQVAKEKKEQDRGGVIVFGSDASIETAMSPIVDIAKTHAVVANDRTDLGAAIRLATAAFPEHGQRRMVLLSDGNENLGDAQTAALSARASGVSIDVAPMGKRGVQDVAVQRLATPSEVKKSQAFEVKVFLESDKAGPSTIRLFRNDQFLGEQTIDLEAGKNLLAFPQSLSEPGFYHYDVRVEVAGDAVPQNNRAIGFTHVRGVPRILIVSNSPEADAPLAAALRSTELELKVVDVSLFPETLAELQSYDSVVFCNVLAADLDRASLERLETAVRDFGMGFVCVGGEDTYAAGAYKGTALDALLPVESDLSSKKVLPPGALMLVIDRSGSMAGDKLLLAKQAAMAAVSVMTDQDYVGVIAFDGVPYNVVELQKAANRQEIIEKIAKIDEGGGTSMYPPMVLAGKKLTEINAAIKHCIVLTDGQSEPGDFDGVTSMMVENRITVSTVGVGEGADAMLLEHIANNGNGRFYFVPNPTQLPQIFLKETAVILKSAISEEPFVPQQVAGSEPLRGFAPGTYPPLLGYVATMPKPRAETPLLTDKGDPLLAHWQYGLGRTVAFTSDARAKWSKEWLNWAQYQQFWRQLVQWSLRRLEDADLTAEVTIEKGEGQLSVEALDEQGNYRNFLTLRATVVSPKGDRQVVTLRQTSPGHYETAFPMRDAGAYLINLAQLENGQVRGSQILGASLNYSPELATSEPNLHLLRRLAETTGGSVLSSDDVINNPYLRDRQKSWQPFDLWPWLLQAAILFFTVDVGVRRVQLEREQLQRGWLAVTGFLFRRPQRSAESDESLSQLLVRREEVRSRQTAVFTPTAPTVQPAKPILPTTPAAAPLTGESVEPTPETPAQTPPSAATVTERLLAAKQRAQKRKE